MRIFEGVLKTLKKDTAMDIKGRNFLKLLDFTPEEINGLVELAARLKADKKAGREKQMLKGKNIVLLFERIPRVRAVPSRWEHTTRGRR